MTWKEKLQKENPESISPFYMGGCSGCPGTHFNEAGDIRVSLKGCPALNHRSNEDSCVKCWNSEIPGTETKNKENDIQNLGSRLAAYEDIGLDPEELKELVKKYVPKPAIVIKDYAMSWCGNKASRRTVTKYFCPECDQCFLVHHRVETLDRNDGYSISNAMIEPGDRRCSCGQLVMIKGTTEKEENANG